MKNLILFLIIFTGLIACEKDLTSITEEGGIKVVHDTIYICNDTIQIDSLIEVGARLEKTNSRACFYIYQLPTILNNGQGPEFIINPPLKFDWDCDWNQTQFMDFTNIGPVIILSPDKPRLFGDVAYKVLEITQFYVQPFGIGVVDKLGTDSLVIVLNNPKVNIPSVIIQHEDDWVGEVSDYLELTPRE